MPNLPYVYQVTKYDPADRDDQGRYVGAEVTTSDHGPQESAYLSAVTSFAAESGVTELTVRDPHIPAFVSFGLEPPIEGHGLAGLFAPDLSDYFDGAVVSIEVGLALVRAMLRDHGAWCQLEVEDRFCVQVGYDQYLYIGSTTYCERALEVTMQAGLFPVRIDRSPYDDLDDDGPAQPADDAFWAEVASLAEGHGAVLLAEHFVRNGVRWHRVEPGHLHAVRRQLAPRAIVEIWPDCSTDFDTVRAQAALMELGCELIWVDRTGAIHTERVEEAAGLVIPGEAVGALVVSSTSDGYCPLAQAVLPDADGVLRARWVPFS
ncbi:hypothetical protein [Kribbella ginsengisoli]|uniref:RNA-binding protein n=1 Tax=Kribbella ginsengisoli TaxID=363865 RepID=A0ABP6X608_9ACTN